MTVASELKLRGGAIVLFQSSENQPRLEVKRGRCIAWQLVEHSRSVLQLFRLRATHSVVQDRNRISEGKLAAAAVMSSSFGKLLLLKMNLSQPEMRYGVVWFQLEYPAEVNLCRVDAIELHFVDCKIPDCLMEFRIQSDRFLKVSVRFFDRSGGCESDGDQVVSADVVGRLLEYCSKQSYAVRQLPSLDQRPGFEVFSIGCRRLRQHRKRKRQQEGSNAPAEQSADYGRLRREGVICLVESRLNSRHRFYISRFAAARSVPRAVASSVFNRTRSRY